VVLGRVVGAHALRGELRVRYLGDGPENLLAAPVVWLGEARSHEGVRRFEVERAFAGRSGEVRLGLVGVRDRDSAEDLRGLLVLGDPTRLAPLAEDEFYWHELVGCTVHTRDGRALGTVREIWGTGAHDVLVVEDASGARHLLPTSRALMPVVDLASRRIVVELVPGLLDSGDH
jgi:16S rRNA processing protein RimM